MLRRLSATAVEIEVENALEEEEREGDLRLLLLAANTTAVAGETLRVVLEVVLPLNTSLFAVSLLLVVVVVLFVVFVVAVVGATNDFVGKIDCTMRLNAAETTTQHKKHMHTYVKNK